MSEVEESGSVEARSEAKKWHTDYVPKVEYAHFLSKINSPQSAYGKLRTTLPYLFLVLSLGIYLLLLYSNLPISINISTSFSGSKERKLYP